MPGFAIINGEALCELCSAPLYGDDIFNHDMRLLGSSRRRLRCVNDHGIIMNGDVIERPVPIHLCLVCALPLGENAAMQARYHDECRNAARKRGRGRFKAGFTS